MGRRLSYKFYNLNAETFQQKYKEYQDLMYDHDFKDGKYQTCKCQKCCEAREFVDGWNDSFECSGSYSKYLDFSEECIFTKESGKEMLIKFCQEEKWTELRILAELLDGFCGDICVIHYT